MPPTPLSDYIKGAAYNRERSLVQLREAVRTLEEDLAERTAGSETEPIRVRSDPSRKVFWFTDAMMARKVRLLGFSAKLVSKKSFSMNGPMLADTSSPNFRRSLEGASFAVVLITPDDEGSLSGGAPRKRARQNVVFELGFFIGKFGTGHVAALVKGDVEKPSDFDGVGYITLDPGGAWKGLLAREMKAAKVPFDPEKVFEA